MSWVDQVDEIEALEDAGLDASLVSRFEAAAPATLPRPIRFSTPTFKEL